MKRAIRLTESDIKKIIKESVKYALKELHGEPEQYIALIYDGIIEDYKAEKMAEEMACSPEEAAAQWFKEVSADGNFEENNMPRHRKFIIDVPEADAEMYYDFGGGYYFLVKKDNKDSLNGGYTYESKIRKAVSESINKLIKEDSGAGATNAAGVMQGGCTNPEAGQYTVPFGKVQRRKIYQPKDKNAGGDVTKQPSNVDMTPAMKRKNGKGSSISIPKS